MRRLLLHMAVVAAALMLPATAQAQRGGGHSGGHGGGGHGGAPGGSHGMVHGSSGHSHGSFDHHHNGFGFVGLGLYGLGYGWPYYGGYGGGYGGYYAPSYYVYNSTPAYYISNYYSPGGLTQPSAPALAKNQAQVAVILPDPEATVWFDGKKTSSVGRVRLFDPPELEPGYTYSYKVTASWVQDGQTVTDVRNAYVVGGQGTVVDFTRPAPAEAVEPPTKKKDQ